MSAFIDQERERFAVELICRTLGVSPSAYYARKSGECCARDVEDERLVAAIRRIHEKNYEAYGQRRMWKALLSMKKGSVSTGVGAAGVRVRG